MKRRRALSEEDLRLWSAVARTTQPLPGRRIDVPAEPVARAGLPEPVEGLPAPAGTAPARKALLLAGAVLAEAPMPARIVQNTIDRPVRRKLGRGRLDIDARIDLHGKTEAIAHYALLSFLRTAHAEGMRHVLVITGRGASSGSTGALRRAFPHWLATDAFRRLVSGFDAAERAHGGDGAFYVRLRKS